MFCLMGNYLKKLCLISTFLLVTSSIWARVDAERRVYYLDASYSMVSPSKLWDPVRADLAKAINAIEDENTEIFVVAFGGDMGVELKTWHGYANPSDKEKIINGFMNFTPKRNTKTFLDRPLNDFYANKVDSQGVTYCFLMTDGKDEHKGPDANLFPAALEQWGRRFDNTDVYGFYVMLNKEARDPRVENIINEQDHLWKVQTADVNINIVRLDRKVKFNVRNDDEIGISISGKTNGLRFHASFPEDADIKVKNTAVRDGKLIVGVSVSGDHSTMPESYNMKLNVRMSGGGEYDIFTTEVIDVECVNKHERVLFTPAGNQKMGKVSHYDKFWFVPGKTISARYSLDFKFNDDAKANPDSYAEFAFVDNKGNLVSEKDMQVRVNGIVAAKNKFTVTPSSESINLEIEFPSGSDRGRRQGYFRLVNHNLHRVNDEDCSGLSVDAFKWTIYNNYKMNPLKTAFLWLGILIAAVALLWFIIIKPIRYPLFPKFKKAVLVKKNGRVVASFNVDFKGARKVVFANQKVKQSALSRIFSGKIATVVNPVFEDSITFVPRKGRKAIGRGAGYTFKSNPIPQSGVTEILSPSRSLIINLQ